MSDQKPSKDEDGAYECINCGADVLLDDEVCPKCGENLDDVYECMNCGADVLLDDEVCPKCDADICELDDEDDAYECMNCGADVLLDDEVCPKCGAEIIGIEEEDVELANKGNIGSIITGAILSVGGLITLIMRNEIVIRIVGKNQVLKEVFWGGNSTQDTLAILVVISAIAMIAGLVLLILSLRKTFNPK